MLTTRLATRTHSNHFFPDIKKIPSATTSPSKLFDIDIAQESPKLKSSPTPDPAPETGKSVTGSGHSEVPVRENLFGFVADEPVKGAENLVRVSSDERKSHFPELGVSGGEIHFAEVEKVSPSFEEADLVEAVGFTNVPTLPKEDQQRPSSKIINI